MDIRLSKNLRRSLLRGHPWVYRDSLQNPAAIKKAKTCRLLDSKGEFLSWAFNDPHSPIAVRILSLNKKNPDVHFFINRFNKAFMQRAYLPSQTTNCYRLFNGEGDGLPGLVCDVYNNVSVLQFDGKGPYEFWNLDLIVNWLKKELKPTCIVLKNRASLCKEAKILFGSLPSTVLVIENSAQFKIDILKGQKTGFFIDQRENRHYLRQISKDKSVLNLFSYTGGFSINAGLGGAKEVTSLDISEKALSLANENWQLNNLNLALHKTIKSDAFDFIQQTKLRWDLIIVDPPSLAANAASKPAATEKYIQLFSQSLLKLNPNGQICFSSCSSHIDFDDFFEIINIALSKARKTAKIIKVAGQSADHPYPHICPELRYLKFVHLSLD